MSECSHDCSSCKENCSERKSMIEKQNDKSNIKKVQTQSLLARQERLYSNNGYNLFYFCYKGVAGIIIEN